MKWRAINFYENLICGRTQITNNRASFQLLNRKTHVMVDESNSIEWPSKRNSLVCPMSVCHPEMRPPLIHLIEPCWPNWCSQFILSTIRYASLWHPTDDSISHEFQLADHKRPQNSYVNWMMNAHRAYQSFHSYSIMVSIRIQYETCQLLSCSSRKVRRVSSNHWVNMNGWTNEWGNWCDDKKIIKTIVNISLGGAHCLTG